MSILEEDDIDEQKEYATVADEEGDNYRDIADMMTMMGFEMNHSSARNYLIRVMKKFAETFSERLGSPMKSEAVMYRIAKDPGFQSSVSELLHIVELDRRREECR
jgi:hypothetical protein